MIGRPLIIFFLIGCALWIVERGLDALQTTEPIDVVIISTADIEQVQQQYLQRTGAQASAQHLAAMVDRLVRERVLIKEAQRLQLDQADPVVAERISKNLEFLDQAPAHGAAWQAQMTLQDPVIQRRLLERMEALLMANSAVNDLSISGVEDYYRQHQDDYREPARYRISHRLVRVAADGSSLTSLVLAAPSQALSASNLARTMPGGLVSQILGAPIGARLQYDSAAGRHEVEVIALEPGDVIPLAQGYVRVWADYQKWLRNQKRKDYVDQLLAFYRIELPSAYRDLLSGVNVGDAAAPGGES